MTSRTPVHGLGTVLLRGREQVSDVFVRINSQGVTLNQADFILTLMSVFWDDGRENWSTSVKLPARPHSRKLSVQPFHPAKPDQLLRSRWPSDSGAHAWSTYIRCLGKGLGHGAYSTSEESSSSGFLPAQHDTLDLTNWHSYFQCLLRAGFRSASMINSQLALLYSQALSSSQAGLLLPPDELRES